MKMNQGQPVKVLRLVSNRVPKTAYHIQQRTHKKKIKPSNNKLHRDRTSPEAMIDQSSLRKDFQSQEESKNFLNARLKTAKESIVLILLGRLFHCRIHEKANVEGQFDRLFETWKFETLPRVRWECVSETETNCDRKYRGPRPCLILNR